MKLRIVVGALFLVSWIAAGAADRKFIVKPRAADMKALPFSDGVLVGNTLYISGHIGLDAKTGVPPASAEDEARLVMDGIKQTVELAGFSMEDVVSIQVFCTDLTPLRQVQRRLQNLLPRRLSRAGIRGSLQSAAWGTV